MPDPAPVAPAQRDELHVPRGAVIFRQGDPGDSMFIIERGTVRIVLDGEGHRTEVAVLGRGDFFGEMSLLSGAARAATAEAAEDCTLLAVRRDVFAMMMQDDLEVVFRMLHAVGVRLGRTDEQFWGLTQRLSRIQLLALALRRAEESAGETPVVLDLAKVADELRVSAPEAEAGITELTRHGAGTLHAGRWVVERPGQLRTAIHLLWRFAAGAGAGSG